MTLSRMLRWVSAIMVLVGALPLYLSQEINLFVWGVFVAGLVTSGFVAEKPFSKSVTQVLTGVLVLGFLLLVLFSVQSGDWLRNAIIFALMATVARGLQLRTARQHFQFIGLSFLLLIASAVTNPDVYFGFVFLVYTVLLTWGLTYTHILEKTERAGGKPGLQIRARQFVSRRFLVGSSVLALLLLASSMIIFFLFPRLGLGFFSAQTRNSQAITGFSDSLELGHFGNMGETGRVVLRIEVPDGEESFPPPGAVRLRGMAFDKYEDGKWSRSSAESVGFRNDEEGYYLVWQYDFREHVPYRTVRYDIYQEPLETDKRILFGLDRVLRVRPLSAKFDRLRGRTPRYRQDMNGNITTGGSARTSITYSVESGLPRYNPQMLRELPHEAPRHIWTKYLQLPPDFDPRFRELAQEVAGDADNPYDIARRLETWLRTNYKYTTQGAGDAEDPVAHFLFERKAGHCEYYAASLVLMLRSLRVAARPVNGFLGAQYNEFGDYYSVTEDRAHSWVEVFFPKIGWVTFDATPPAESRQLATGFWAQMERWLDSLKLQWYKWMVEYDLEKQLSVYARVINLLSPKNSDVQLSPDMSIGEFRREMKKMGNNLFSARTGSILFGVFFGLVIVPWLVRRFRQRDQRQRSKLDQLAQQLRAVLRKRGLFVTTGATLPALARQAEQLEFSALEDLKSLVLALEKTRWAPDRDESLQSLRRQLARVRKGRLPKRKS